MPLAFDDIKARLEMYSRLAPPDRDAFLNETCGGDQERRDSIAKLYDERFALRDRRVGPYRIDRELGRGGMGVVYLASRDDQQYDRQVVIKLLQQGQESSEVLRRFQNERQILAHLDHPNICRLFDGGVTEEGELYFVMEYVRGALPIDEYANRHHLSVVDRLKLFQQACAAVQYAHRFLIVHRDLKPANILVSDEGVVKLMDFGIAKDLMGALSADAAAKTIGLQPMTPAYASPEQVRGGQITTSSDVYALGVVLYELLTGRHPFRMNEQAVTELLEVICKADPPRPSTVVVRPGMHAPADGVRGSFAQSSGEGLPSKLSKRLKGDLDWIVLMALRKDPLRRYASVEQFSQDIQKHLENRPVIARSDTLAYRTRKFVERNRFGIAAVALVILSLTAGIITTRIEQGRAKRRFNDVRELAHSVLFEIPDAITDSPGSTKVRALLVNRALTYLDRLARDAGSDLTLEAELADAYRRVGDLQFKVGNPNLGDIAGAIGSARKELEIRESIVRDDRRPEPRMALAATHQRMYELLIDTGDPANASKELERSLQIREDLAAANPKDAKMRAELAAAFRVAGDRQKAVGTPERAAEYYQKALGIRQALAAESPRDAVARRQVSMDLVRIGDVFGSRNEVNLGRYDEARRLYSEAVAIRLSLLAENPNAPGPKRDVANVYQRLGSMLIDMGELRESINTSRKALAIYEDVFRMDPANFEVRRDLAMVNNQMGVALDRLNDDTAAEKAFRDGVAICTELLATNNKSDRSRDDLAYSQYLLGSFLANNRRAAEGSLLLERAMATYEDLLAKNADDGRYNARLAKVIAEMAALHARSGQREIARLQYGRAIAISRALRDKGKLSAIDRGDAERWARAMDALAH